MMEKPTLTIIIPTLNEEEYLPHLLEALLMQTHQPEEIIVADAGSIDHTVEIAQEFGASVVEGGLPATGRNAGARVANCDLVFFLDADVVPPFDFIEQVLDEFIRRNLDGATCLIDPLTDSKKIDKLICQGTNFYFRIINPVSPHAPGFCIISKRTFHEKLGGFDESLFLSEDIDYARRATKIGRFDFLNDPKIPVSMRRVKKEGFLGIGFKYLWCEIYAFIGKPVRNVPFQYEFGNFDSTSDQNEFYGNQQQWRRIYKYISGFKKMFLTGS